ncbi:MAG: hypothetical protein AMJ53_01290 [Gammaproteobacteria bacterium SG8_11]|nr:MAG: hypothetical protein AMJ53_01290 [Gammaproteobacteria bacterium SG8_11]
MLAVTTRYPEEVVKQIKILAKERQVKEAEIWRLVAFRGLDSESSAATHFQVEMLCLLRRLVGESVGTDTILKAKQDARELLRQMGIIE